LDRDSAASRALFSSSAKFTASDSPSAAFTNSASRNGVTAGHCISSVKAALTAALMARSTADGGAAGEAPGNGYAQIARRQLHHPGARQHAFSVSSCRRLA
jgi:hypothetical protein